MSERFDKDFWDEQYRSHPTLWSGNPNTHLLSEAGNLRPGSALEVGCGEGADAIWLAGRGWRVTAVDLSTVALERALTNAGLAGGDVATRIEWVQADVTSCRWDPGRDRYDLVSAQYFHLPSAARRALVDRLAAAVAPGGTMLMVAHHPSDLETSMPRPHLPDLFFTGDDIAAQVNGDWDIVTNEAPARKATHDGQSVTIHDTVFRAQRHRG